MMVNRWFHPPKLHTPAHGKTRRVGWLELFYDLIYVAAIIQLGNGLSANYGEMKYGAFLVFAGLFVPMWLTWTSYTFYSNRFVVDDLLHRVMVFIQMFGIAGMAIGVGDVFQNDTVTFVACYTVVRVMLVLIYLRTWLQETAARELSRRYVIYFGVGALCWGVSLLFPAPWSYVLWAIALVVDFAASLSRQSRVLTGRHPPDVSHMIERYGLLTIIVLGESFVKVISSVAEHGFSGDYVLMGMLGLAVTFSLWWIYFDDVADSRIRDTPLAAYIWVYTHLPLTIGITGVGVAVKKVVVELDPFEPEGAKYRILLCGALGLTLLCVAVIDAVTARRSSEMADQTRVRIRAGAGALVLLVAPAGAMMDGWVFVGLIASVCVVQVLFDLSMAPMVDPEDAHHDTQLLPRTLAVGEEPPAAEEPQTRRFDIGDAVRKGTPSELKRDFYFHLMEGSWAQFFGVMFVAYIITNVVFASLFLLEPEGVSGMGTESFLDAFSFSVQTLTTIGYGAMSPTSAYAHTVMIVEAAIGLLGVAFATGLLFAKASRPRSSVLFSDVVLIHTYDGEPTLSFRAGNARGNEVVEASMNVAVLRDMVTPEGHTMRRLHDLKLHRRRTPVFTLSWTVMHTIDEDSPLYNVTAETAAECIFSIIVTMTGHDSTYAQTVHARKLYLPQDMRWDHRFVDVISTAEDGRLLVDYTKFHQTLPMEPAE